MPIKPIAALSLALSLAGCAAASPGFVPEGGRQNRMAMLKPDPGTLDGAGQYKLSETEQKLDCKKINGSMQIIVSRLRDSDNRPRPSQTTLAMQNSAKVVGRDTSSFDLNGELRRERARLDAYNQQLAAKGCKTMDVEAALKAPR